MCLSWGIVLWIKISFATPWSRFNLQQRREKCSFSLSLPSHSLCECVFPFTMRNLPSFLQPVCVRFEFFTRSRECCCCCERDSTMKGRENPRALIKRRSLSVLLRLQHAMNSRSTERGEAGCEIDARGLFVSFAETTITTTASTREKRREREREVQTFYPLYDLYTFNLKEALFNTSHRSEKGKMFTRVRAREEEEEGAGGGGTNSSLHR